MQGWCHLAGLVDEIEIEQLRELVERKQKTLYFRPPVVAIPSALLMLRAHPMFADIPEADFAKQVRLKHVINSLGLTRTSLCVPWYADIPDA